MCKADMRKDTGNTGERAYTIMNSMVNAADMQLRSNLYTFTDAKSLPLSFVYDGRNTWNTVPMPPQNSWCILPIGAPKIRK